MFVYVFGGAIDTGGGKYVNYLLPGILLITVASGVAYTALRLFTDVSSGIFERFQSMPIARSAVLWGHVLTSLIANLISLVLVVLVALAIGFRSGAGVARLARGARHHRAVHAGADLAGGERRARREVARRRGRVRLPAAVPAVRQLGVRAHRPTCPARCSGSPSTSPSPRSSTRSATCTPTQPLGNDSGPRSPGASASWSWPARSPCAPTTAGSPERPAH